MMQLNLGDHRSAFAEFGPFPLTTRHEIQWSRQRANWIARNKREADRYFRTLPRRWSLTQLLTDRRLWVNFIVDRRSTDFGLYDTVTGELGIGMRAFNMGRWTVLATLIHELAHANGAPGEPSQAAEQALLACGLGRFSELIDGDDPQTPFDPTIVGAIQRVSAGNVA